MNYILDTHTFLWTMFDPGQLSRKATKAILPSDHSIFISIVSLWEISLKYALGKIAMQQVLPDDLPEIARHMDFDTLDITAQEVSTFYKLPRTEHKDPFDRLIAWQAIQRGIPLISKDEGLRSYKTFGLKLIW